MTFRHIFRHIQKSIDDMPHSFQFVFPKIILGYADICLYDFYLAIAFLLNYFHFGNSCLTLQFSHIKNIIKMLIYSRDSYIK